MPAKRKHAGPKPDLKQTLDPAKKKPSKKKGTQLRRAATKSIGKKKTPQETGAMGGRPPLELDEAKIEQLAMLQCPKTEIANEIGCSVDTLDRRYADLVNRGRDKGRVLMRKWGMDSCKKGNATMLKYFLGNFCDMTEKVDPNQPAGPVQYTQINVNFSTPTPARDDKVIEHDGPAKLANS